MEISEWDTLSIISEVFNKMLSVGRLATYYLCIGLAGGKCMEKLTQNFIECGQYYTKHDLESLIHVATLISVAGCVCAWNIQYMLQSTAAQQQACDCVVL